MLFLTHIVLHGLPRNMPQEIKFCLYKGVRQVLVHEGKVKEKKISRLLFTHKICDAQFKLKDLLSGKKKGAQKAKKKGKQENGEEEEEEDEEEQLVLPCPNVPLCGDIKLDFVRRMKDASSIL